MSNRTPSPWFIDQYGSVNKKEGRSNDRVTLEGFALNCSFDREARDNTKFVVLACNNHNKLVDALRSIESMYDHDKSVGQLSSLLYEAKTLARSVLADIDEE